MYETSAPRYCLLPCAAPLPCGSCSAVVFCSSACASAASSFHQFECGFTSLLYKVIWFKPQSKSVNHTAPVKINHTTPVKINHTAPVKKAELGAWWLAYRALTCHPWSHYRCFLLFHFFNLSPPTDCFIIGSTGKNMVADKKGWGLVRLSGGRMTPSPSTDWSPTTALRRSLRS